MVEETPRGNQKQSDWRMIMKFLIYILWYIVGLGISFWILETEYNVFAVTIACVTGYIGAEILN